MQTEFGSLRHARMAEPVEQAPDLLVLTAASKPAHKAIAPSRPVGAEGSVTAQWLTNTKREGYALRSTLLIVSDRAVMKHPCLPTMMPRFAVIHVERYFREIRL